ncbi:energy-converting hydrogenase A subunit A EhaA [Methanobrevibacter smithii]|uniref:Probable [NiFe]-hydrogenase-type-3 Eha complex membrane subunit A n=1 Tax=Methanobrevibacter smithii TaxID=2173 RepID=A0A2H4U5G0_METSM|nr:energy-converting hydrogenase A subunit A EhaA [Methanobrevibacter smithii]ATZ59351.1 energy-converting hydrogenase A subunit A EhaA [Methanobrevibacter smithii]
MFNLSMVHSCVYSGAYGLANINISSFDAALCYIVAIAVSIVVALILRVPLLPSKPYMYSFDVSALYPTPVIAIGILSLFFVLGYTFIYNGLVLSVVIGVLTALFVKYLFYEVFPKPLHDNEEEAG